MAKTTNHKCKIKRTGVPSPIYGISHENITTGSLTVDNWQKKAIVRVLDGHSLYIHIMAASEGSGMCFFAVDVYQAGSTNSELSSCDFEQLADALAVANGEVGALAESSSATPDEWPTEFKPGWTIGSVGSFKPSMKSSQKEDNGKAVSQASDG